MFSELPDWIDAEAWAGYVEMRKAIKKPMTERAKKLALNKLVELRAKGYDPNAILDEATFSSWQGLWEPKAKPQPKEESSSAWAEFRACIRDARQPQNPILQKLALQLGGIGRLGEKTSYEIDRMRADFDAGYRQLSAH